MKRREGAGAEEGERHKRREGTAADRRRASKRRKLKEGTIKKKNTACFLVTREKKNSKDRK